MTGVFQQDKLALTRKFFLKSLHASSVCGGIYVNNPKVACSTIKLALQRTQIGDHTYQPARSVHDYAGSPLVTWPDIDVADARRLLADYFTFSFVRCPYRRLQSAYANKIVKPQKKGVPRQQAGFDAHEIPEFGAFVEAITAQDPLAHNPHWRAQSINLSVDAVHYDFIGRLETFSADWAKLSERLNLPAEPERAGKTTNSSRATYTARTAALVARAYARDFEIFGYDTDNIPLTGAQTGGLNP